MNRDSIHVLIDSDSTRVLELTPYAFSQLLAGQAVGAPKAELVSAQDVWAMPAEQVIADSTLEGRINEFVTSVAEKYARNEGVKSEGVEYIEGRYFPAVVALSMDKRSALLAQLEASWRPHKGRPNTNPIRSWGRVIMGVADYLLRPVTLEQVDRQNAADIIVRLARWYHTPGSQFQQRRRKAGESGTGPILLNWVTPPTSERSSPGRGILISAHLSRATRGTIGRL